MCTCDQTGVLVCNPCPGKDAGGTGATGGTTGGTGGTTGGGACQPGAACQPGGACSGGDPATGACQMCNCDQTGVLVCNPCPGKDGGAPPPPSDGGTMVSCQMSTMPSTGAGTPCGVMEACTDGTSYRVRCDGISGNCDCLMNGNPVATISLSCDTLDPKVALGTCKFPTQ
jgi:hypothetical protein